MPRSRVLARLPRRASRHWRAARVIGTLGTTAVAHASVDDRQEDRVRLVGAATLERARVGRDHAFPPLDDVDVVILVDADDELTSDRCAHEHAGHASDELRVAGNLAVEPDAPYLHPVGQRYRDELATPAEVEHSVQEVQRGDGLLVPGIHDDDLRAEAGPHQGTPDRGDGVSLEDVDDRLGVGRAGQCAQEQDGCRDDGGEIQLRRAHNDLLRRNLWQLSTCLKTRCSPSA